MTVHCSCTMHMAKSPAECERKVLYGGFSLPSDERTDAEMAKVTERRSRVLDASSV